MGLQETEAAAAAVAVSPDTRVKLADIEAAIAGEFYATGEDFARVACAGGFGRFPAAEKGEDEGLEIAGVIIDGRRLTICLIVLTNGFCVIGKAAPADPTNFNAELGRKFAREDAIRQLWPLMGFALRERLRAGG